MKRVILVGLLIAGSAGAWAEEYVPYVIQLDFAGTYSMALAPDTEADAVFGFAFNHARYSFSHPWIGWTAGAGTSMYPSKSSAYSIDAGAIFRLVNKEHFELALRFEGLLRNNLSAGDAADNLLYGGQAGADIVISLFQSNCYLLIRPLCTVLYGKELSADFQPSIGLGVHY